MNVNPGSAVVPHSGWLLAGLILLLAGSIRCLDLDKSLWADEALSYLHATDDDFIASARTNVHPPLYFGLLRLTTATTHSIPVLRLISVGCGVGVVLLLLRAVPAPAAGIAGFLAACSPEMVYQAQELRHYALLTLLLTVALLATVRLCDAATAGRARILLAGSLALAAATHLVTGFFLLPLAALLGWVHRRKGFKLLATLGALFVPAALLLVFFHGMFLTSAKSLDASTWWMAPAQWSDVVNAVSVASGWDAVRWLAAACGRHLSAAEPMLLVAMAAAVGLMVSMLWASRSVPLVRRLVFIAIGYWAAVVGYSFAALSLLLPRIFIPGLVPLFLALAVSVAAHPSGLRRKIATSAIGAFGLAAMVPWLWFFAWVPREDLRGLAEAARRSATRGEMVVFLGGTAVAADIYWPEFRHSDRKGRIDVLQPLDPQLNSLRRVIGAESGRRDVLLAYHMDAYLQSRQAVLSETIAFLRAQGLGAPAPVWRHNFYHLVRLAHGAGHPSTPP